jgi:TrmH family RNA methyltransferase
MLAKAKLKYIQTLGQKKHWEQEGLFIAEGPKIVNDLLEAIPQKVKVVYALEDWIRDNSKWMDNATIVLITEMELGKISQLTTPNKVLAVVQQFDMGIPVAIKNTITLVLDSIRDPGNLGTIIRTADWFGIRQVVCSLDSADIYNPKVVQSTMGSIARVKIHYTDLEAWLALQKGIHVYATTISGQDLATVNKMKEGIIIIGNESKGISPEILKRADTMITIPRKGKAESLNAAIAVGIVLSHLC